MSANRRQGTGSSPTALNLGLGGDDTVIDEAHRVRIGGLLYVLGIEARAAEAKGESACHWPGAAGGLADGSAAGMRGHAAGHQAPPSASA